MWPNMIFFLLTTVFNLLSASQAIPLLIWKAPHSGSSWLTSLFNFREGVYVSEEMFEKLEYTLDMKNWTNPRTLFNESCAYLAEALRHPMAHFPRGEFHLDNRDLLVVGASLDIQAYWVNLWCLPKMVPDIRVLLWVRTNKVKHTISNIRAAKLRAKCGNPVIIGDCRLTKKTVVNLKIFDWDLINILALDKMMLDKATRLRKGIEPSHFTRLSYEEMMGDKHDSDSLLRWAGASPETMNWQSKAVRGKCRNGGCSKSTPDDLREIVENYKEVESWIESNYPCLIHQFHETRPDVVQKPVELLCGSLLKDRIEDFVAAYYKKRDNLLSKM